MIALLVSALFVATTLACGGFFCSFATPVVQSGENILFTMDGLDITATIQVRRRCQARDFRPPTHSALMLSVCVVGLSPASLDVAAAPSSQNSFRFRPQIQYAGDSSKFSWVLPLPGDPTGFGVASDQLFRALHQFTDPTFSMTIKQPENCTTWGDKSPPCSCLPASL